MTAADAAAPAAALDQLGRLAARHDLALAAAQLVSFEVDTVTGAAHWSDNLPVVFGGADPARLLADVLAPLAAAQTAAAGGGDVELEHRVRVGGDERCVLVRARPTSPTTWVGVLANVTEHRRAEQDSRELLDRYRLLVELSPDGIIVHEGGVVRYANPAAARFARLPAAEMVGRPIVEFVHPDDLGPTLARIAALTEAGMVSEPAEARLLAADGTTLVFESTSVRTTWQGRPAFQVILRDTTERRRADAATRFQASLVAAVPDAIIATDPALRITAWNPAAETIYGWSAADVAGRELRTVLQAAPDVAVVDEDTLFSYGCWAGDAVHRRRDGSPVEVAVSITLLRGEDGEPAGAVALARDLTDQRAAERERRRAEERFSAVVASLEEGVIVVDVDGRVEASNAAAERLLGVDAAGLVGWRVSDGRFVDVDGRPLDPAALPALGAAAAGEETVHAVVGLVRGGGTRWLSVNARPLRDGAGPVRAVVCSFTDVTEQRRAAEQLAWAATHDALTGLPNRALTLDRLRAALARAQETNRHVAVCFIDVDRFKAVNDGLGHETGDRLLQAVADRLRATVRATDTIGRFAGDEFVAVLEDVDGPAAAVEAAERIAAAIGEPVEVVDSHGGTHTIGVAASIGVAVSAADHRSPAELLHDADVAMYQAKQRGRGRVEVFDETLRAAAQQRLETAEDLRAAIERGELRLHYQPIVAVDGRRRVGFEALVRWQHPTKGLRGPGEFIPVAEETGLIAGVGAWVLREACAQLAAWRDGGVAGGDCYVSVNLSARQLSDPSLVPTVVRALADTGLPAGRLCLELTESTLAADADAAAAVLDALASLGVRLAIDDFGTGFSSLAYLKRFPVSALKIDRGFVAGLGSDPDDSAIVASVVELGHALGLSVVAEGVETATQLDALAALGCDAAQGYLLGRPVPAAAVG